MNSWHLFNEGFRCNNMNNSYDNIMVCVAQELDKIQSEKEDIEFQLKIAKGVLRQHNLYEEYLTRWKKRYLINHIIIAPT